MNFIQIPEAPDYEISRDGVVRNRATQRHIKGHRMAIGYRAVDLIVDGNRRRFAAHRLLAKMFISNSEGLPEVNHIDRDRSNDSLDNLEWVTPSQNIRHAFTTGVGNRLAIINYDQVPALLAAYLTGSPLRDLSVDVDRSALRKLLKREAERQGKGKEFFAAQQKNKQTLVQRQSKRVRAVKNGEVLDFDSINAAARHFNKNPSSVWKALKHDRPLLGYAWGLV